MSSIAITIAMSRRGVGSAFAALLIAGAGAPTLAADGAPQYGAWGFDLSGMDRSARPGDDFFRYANGAWLKHTEIPADRSNFGMHAALAERALLQLRTIMEDAGKADPKTVEGKVGAYYAAFIDEARIDQLGTAPLKPSLDAVRAAPSREALAAVRVSTALFTVICTVWVTGL